MISERVNFGYFGAILIDDDFDLCSHQTGLAATVWFLIDKETHERNLVTFIVPLALNLIVLSNGCF